MKDVRMWATNLSLSAVVVWTCAATPAFAAKQGGFVGAGVAASPDYEGSDDYEANAALFGRYTWESGRYVDLGGTLGAGKALRFKANLIPESMSPMWQAGPVLQYRPERDDVDDNVVDRFAKVDDAVEVGAFAGIVVDRWQANVTAAADASDAHDGYLVEVSGSYTVPVRERFSLSFGVSTTYADDDYMSTYFGVSAADAARSGLPIFDASSGFKNVGVNVTGRYRFKNRWGLLGNVGYDRLLGDASDSPLVDTRGDENQFSAVLALTYSF